MAKVAETRIDLLPTKLSNLNDIWNNTIVLGLSQSSGLITPFSNNFRYRTEVSYIDIDDNVISVGQYEYPSRPVDLSSFGAGYGAFSVSNPLKSFFKLDYESIYITSPTQSKAYALNLPPAGPLVKYYLNNGFSYNPNLNVEAFESVVSGNSFLSFSFSSINTFNTGTVIYVVSDNPFISGGHTITSNATYNQTYSFITQTLFTASMTTATPDATITNYIQYDSVIQYLYGIDCRLGYEDLDYGIIDHLVDGNINNWKDGTTYKFLNTYPNRDGNFPPISATGRSGYFINAKNTRVDQYETLSFVIDTDSLNSVLSDLRVHYTTYSPTFSSIQNIEFNLNFLSPNTGLKRVDVPIGFNNLSGTFSTPNSVEYVICYIADSNVVTLYSEVRKFKYDRSCSIYEKRPFIFKNSLGAWDFWTFTQDQKETKTMTRNEYKQEIPFGNFVSGVNSGSFYRGRNIYSGKVETNYSVNTNWISEKEYSYLSELMESSDVYILKYYPQKTAYLPVPIMITDTSYEIKTAIRDQIFNLTMNYRISVDTPMQQGQ